MAEATIEELAARGREISAIAANDPQRVAVSSDHGSLTFAELDRQAEALAAVFAGAGLESDDILAVLSTNRPEWIVTMQAALRAGLRLVPVNWHLEADDIAYVITDSGARALVAEDIFARELTSAVDTIEIRLVIGGPVPGYSPFADATTDPRAAPTDRHRGSLMFYTSGTTGRPKGVRLSSSSPSGTSAATGQAMVAMFGMDGDRGDSMLCPAPLYHSGPSRLCAEWPLGAGVTVHLMHRFDPVAALDLIDRHRISHAFFVPTMFHRMLQVPDRERYDVSSLGFVLHGAGQCPTATKHQMFDWLGPIIHEMYAST